MKSNHDLRWPRDLAGLPEVVNMDRVGKCKGQSLWIPEVILDYRDGY